MDAGAGRLVDALQPTTRRPTWAAPCSVNIKPEPTLLLEAARQLDVPPSRCVVVESTKAGVSAGRDAGFALVIGVDRTGHADELRRSFEYWSQQRAAPVADVARHRSARQAEGQKRTGVSSRQRH